MKWAEVMRPTTVVIENVPGFLESTVWRRLASRFEALGYEVVGHVLNALDFGVPQSRTRSFTIASKKGLPEIHIPKRRSYVTVREAWDGLSRRPNGENFHYGPSPSELAFARMRVIPAGGDKRDILDRRPDLAPPSWRKVTCEVTDVWGRMDWDAPCNTLRTAFLNPSKGRYIHPSQHRVITLREAARLQSIPDSFQFEGLPTQIARQIGNSVPPKLGRAVARAVFDSL